MGIKQFLAKEDFSLSDFHTLLKDSGTIEEAKAELKKVRKKISDIQDKMYASNRYSVLICFQGMDTAGKDSLIREVFKNINARGVVVYSFKTPSAKELQHDYLWRHYIALPEKGKFSVFNRSHYENVLITKVHPEIILNERIPQIKTTDDIDDTFWNNRYESINHFEKHLAENGVIILKFFLNLSKEEQRKRLLRRLEKPKHNWKFSPGDLSERQLWDQYMQAYEALLKKTSKTNAPWYVIPSDVKEIQRLLVARIIYKTLKQYEDIEYPEADEEIQSKIKVYKEALEKDA
ncbi:PPK2 family polyphosphate kinase [Paenimyroides ceti]